MALFEQDGFSEKFFIAYCGGLSVKVEGFCHFPKNESMDLSYFLHESRVQWGTLFELDGSNFFGLRESLSTFSPFFK